MPLYILTCLPEDVEYLHCKAAVHRLMRPPAEGEERTAEEILEECYEVIEKQQKVT
jgi:hypothetical protein